MTTEWFGAPMPWALGPRPGESATGIIHNVWGGRWWMPCLGHPTNRKWVIPPVICGISPNIYIYMHTYNIYIYTCNIHIYIYTHTYIYIYMGYKPLTKWHAHPCGDEFRESICGPPVDHGHIPLCSQSNHLYFCSLYPAKCPCLAACLIPKCRWWPPKKRLMVLKWLTINWGNYEG